MPVPGAAADVPLAPATRGLLPAEDEGEDAVEEQAANASTPAVNADTTMPVRPKRDNTMETPDD